MKSLLVIACLLISVLSVSATEDIPEYKPFFQKSKNQPYHLSIGAVLFDQQGRIACHHFKDIYGYKNVYILMRESMENNETPLMTLERGLKEEFEATAQPIAFLGGLIGHLPDAPLSFEKTTLYVACQLIAWDPANRNLEDPEGSSVIEWLDPDLLVSLMQDQATRYPNRIDLNESEMVKRAVPYIQSK